VARRTYHAKGLKALEGLKYISWEELGDATGLSISTLRWYKSTDPTFPQPEKGVRNHKGASIWNTNRQDVQDWITGKSRRGRGYRTDLYGPKQ
jgi:predicted DNA-binding transcriptional regulator AlpA